MYSILTLPELFRSNFAQIVAFSRTLCVLFLSVVQRGVVRKHTARTLRSTTDQRPCLLSLEKPALVQLPIPAELLLQPELPRLTEQGFRLLQSSSQDLIILKHKHIVYTGFFNNAFPHFMLADFSSWT